MADDLTINAKKLAHNRANDAALTSVVGGLIGILETRDSSITEEVSKMLTQLKQRVTAANNNIDQPTSAIVQYFIESYVKEIDSIQIQRDASKKRVEKSFREGSVPEG